MSDFDKEAEREKLRRKYESEQEDREATQQMSELLLQGATMTSQHCDTCGSPIFRYDGTEFCPTCQQETGEASDAGGDVAASGQSDADRQEASDVAAEAGSEADDPAAEPGEESGEAGESTSGQEPTGETPARRPPQSASRRAPPSQRGASRERSGGSRSRTRRGRAESAGTQTPSGRADASRDERQSEPSPRRRDAGDLGEARAALVRKLTRLAREAEETDDVARARDLLAATREAAEALAALDRANR